MRVPYQTGNPDTGVRSYELVPHGIILEFQNRARYLYNAKRPGPEHLAEITRRALAGKGLSTYIAQHIGDQYARKLSSAGGGLDKDHPPNTPPCSGRPQNACNGSPDLTSTF